MRLLSGDLYFADVVLDNLPAEPHVLDHGSGRCQILAQQAMAYILPLPESLKDYPERTWLADSQVQADVRAWLNEHRDKLKWDEKKGVYHESE